MTSNLTTSSDKALPLHVATKSGLAGWLKGDGRAFAAWVEAGGFRAEAGKVLMLPGKQGKPVAALGGLGDQEMIWSWAALAQSAPAGAYRLAAGRVPFGATRAALGWALGAYRFDRYKKKKTGARPAKLVWPQGADKAYVANATAATALARDLINTPAEDMGPEELARAAQDLGAAFAAKVRVIVGDELLAQNFPAIHAVGRAATRAPRLIDLVWGEEAAPKVTLVGKGVCFDSGGLDLKPAAGKRMMKKDMGGAATVLGLARMIMAAKLKVRLRVLVPAVENAVAGNAYRPGDIVKTRKGLSVEIGNTDAEGRVILCDALAEADAEKPALLIDIATLTGAARVALGPDLPALFVDDEALAAKILHHGGAEEDPLWRLPLWKPYRRFIETPVADISNSGDSPFAGSVTAALFLRTFVAETTPWAHIDSYAWADKGMMGRSGGGEPLAMRALFALIAERFGG
jgi:leucyl aminopeptidase